MEPTSSSTLSGLQSPPSSNLQQRGNLEPAGNEGGSSSSVNRVCHVQTRHYKRRRSNEVARTGVAAAPLTLDQVEDPSSGASRMTTLEILNRTAQGIIELSDSEPEESPTKISVQTKSAMEVDKMQQSKGIMQMAMACNDVTAPDLTDSLQVTSCRKRKHSRANQKTRRSRGQKKTELETGRSMKSNVMQHAPAEKDGIVAVEDHAATTEVQEDVHVDRAVPGSLKALHAKIRAEKGDESGVRCGRKDRRNDDTRKYWQCPMNAMKGRTLCDHHFLLAEANRARYALHRKKAAAAKRQGNSDFKSSNNNDVGLSGSHTEFHQVPAEAPESLPLKPSIDTPSQAIVLDEKLEAPDIVDGISDDDHGDHADSDADQSLPHMLKNASQRWYVAPRKTTDANMKVNSHDRETLIVSPMIPPRPAMNGGGRKAQLFRSLLKSL